jgi:adenylosuccinate lyase
MPESFLVVDEIINTTIKLLEELHVHERQIQRNLETYGPFAASEAILMKAVTKGANRQGIHETLRTIAMSAWKDVQEGKANSMKQRVQSDSTIQKYLDPDELELLFNVKTHTGTAATRVKKIIKINKTRVEMTQ